MKKKSIWKPIYTTRAIALVITVAVALGAGWWVAGRQNEAANNKLTVVASFYPLYEFARQVGGDRVTVSNLTPAGVEPHDYEPTPQQLAKLQQADVVVYNGGTMEPWTENAVADLGSKALNASTGLSLREGLSEDGQPLAGSRDPHYWLDPVAVQTVVRTIADKFAEVDPSGRSYYDDRARGYIAKLAALDADYQAGLKQCRTRTIVTSHDAYSYVAARYNLNVEAIAGLSPEEEPSVAKLAQLSQLVRSQNLKFVFFEELVSPKLAETVAQEAGAQTLVYDPIEGLSDEDIAAGKDYLSVQRENLANLRQAMECN